MTKKFYSILIVSIFYFSGVNAQDTANYEIQRAKINALLAERSAKFGQYDQSLNARTGIFGLQTKKDLKNSNEILRKIALNDNEIFTELKVLMDFKDLQVEQVKVTANNNGVNILNYRKTIKTLQDQNKILTANQDKVEQAKDLAQLIMYFLFGACIILIYSLYLKKKKIKSV